MDKFQKKITQMRYAIDNIKSDIECMKTISPNEYVHPSNNKTTISTQSNDTINQGKISIKTNYTQFKDNCPIRKENHSNNPISSKGNKSHYVGNVSKHYNFNYPLDHTSNETVQSYGKLSEYMNTKAIQQNASMIKPMTVPQKQNQRLEKQRELQLKQQQSLIQETPQQQKRLHRNRQTSSDPKLLSHINDHNKNLHLPNNNNHSGITKTINNSSRTIQVMSHITNSNRTMVEKRNSQPYNHYNYNSNKINHRQSEQSKLCSRTVTYHNDYDSIDNEYDNDTVVNEMIDITNKYYSDSLVITYDNIIEQYKRTLKKIKVKDELINKMMQMYMNMTGEDISRQDNSILVLWKWMKELTANNGHGNSNNNSYRNSQRKKRNANRSDSHSKDHPNYYEKERQMSNNQQFHKQYQDQDDFKERPQYNNNQQQPQQQQNEVNLYQQYCERIMKDFNIPNMDELMFFIDRLLQKGNKNDNFLEGIKKILLSENKNDDYLYS